MNDRRLKALHDGPAARTLIEVPMTVHPESLDGNVPLAKRRNQPRLGGSLLLERYDMYTMSGVTLARGQRRDYRLETTHGRRRDHVHDR
jgi:hypothetical protein